MSNKSVFCLVTTKLQADQIVNRLQSSGYPYEDISVLFPDKATSRDLGHEKNSKAPEGAATGAGTGGLLGGTLGLLVGIGALAIPGVGPFIAAGPIMAALSGAAAGAALGGITGALIGMGIPEYEARRYEGKIREGRILISVHTDTADEVRVAKEILEAEGAEDIGVSGEASVPEDAKRPLQERGSPLPRSPLIQGRSAERTLLVRSPPSGRPVRRRGFALESGTPSFVVPYRGFRR